MRARIKTLLERFEAMKISGWEWFRERADSRHARVWLALIFFSEASFLLIIPDLFLIALALARPHRWFSYAMIATLASVSGGLFGYLVGAFFFDAVGVRIIDFYRLAEEAAQVKALYDRNTFWIVFTAAFTPIPYKVFVLAGGFLKVNVFLFVLASFLGRGLRFFMVGYVTKRFGEHVLYVLFRYLNIATVVLVVIIIAFFFNYPRVIGFFF